MTIDPEDAAQQHAAASLARGDATGWFDELYREAATGATSAPWDRGEPHPLLVEWAAGPRDGTPSLLGHRTAARLPAGRALVVGCGYGYDAAHLVSLGLDVTGFDVSPTVVAQAQERVPAARFRTADLLDPPAEWQRAFDVVVEIMTVQSMPPELHESAAAEVAGFVAPGGRLLVVGGVGEAGVRADGPPWPLTREELDHFLVDGLEIESLDELPGPPRPRWRMVLTRPA